MKIVYLGNNQRGIVCLKSLNKSKHEVVFAIAQDGEEGWYESIVTTSAELGIDFLIKNNPNDRNTILKIKKLKPDLIVMCGYSKYIGKELRSIPKKGCINCHASRLPYYRGAAPLNWAIINGEEIIGLSILFVDGGIDTGDILAQELIRVSIDDTIDDILQKTLKIYPRMLLKVCNEIDEGVINAKKQNLDEGSYYTKRRPEDGLIRWEDMTDVQIYNMVRALTHPFPGAFSNYRRSKVYLWDAKLEKRNYYGTPGRIATKGEYGIIVIAKNRGLRLTSVQVEGKTERNPNEYKNPRFEVGDNFE